MQISCEINGCRENTLVILSLTLSEKLLPPFREIMQCRLIIDHDLNGLQFIIENIPYNSILITLICTQIRFAVFIICIRSSGHKLIYADAADCNWQKPHSSQ